MFHTWWSSNIGASFNFWHFNGPSRHSMDSLPISALDLMVTKCEWFWNSPNFYWSAAFVEYHFKGAFYHVNVSVMLSSVHICYFVNIVFYLGHVYLRFCYYAYSSSLSVFFFYRIFVLWYKLICNLFLRFYHYEYHGRIDNV